MRGRATPENAEPEEVPSSGFSPVSRSSRAFSGSTPSLSLFGHFRRGSSKSERFWNTAEKLEPGTSGCSEPPPALYLRGPFPFSRNQGKVPALPPEPLEAPLQRRGLITECPPGRSAPCFYEDGALTDEPKGSSRDREVRDGLFVPGGEPGPGRPYTPPTAEQCRTAKHACRLGATDQDLAAIIGVSASTIKKWMCMDEEFSHACKVGGDMADARVERALFQRAVGGRKAGWREAATKDGDVVTLEWEEDLPPDTAAASRWLEARNRKDWGVKSVVQHEGDIEVRDSRSALAKLVGRHKAREQ